MSDLSALIRCVRCGEALTPRTSHPLGLVSIALKDGELSGLCISPIDGSVEPTHRFIRIEARTEDPSEILFDFEYEADDGEDRKR